MDAGKAIVASAIGRNRYVIDEDVTGKLFEPGNRTDLVRAVRQLVGNPAACQRMGVAARARIRVDFSEEEFYHTAMDIYAEARQIRRL